MGMMFRSKRKKWFALPFKKKLKFIWSHSICPCLSCIYRIKYKSAFKRILKLSCQAAAKVSKFMHSQVKEIKNSLDGKNVDIVLGTLGQRYHRLTYEHLTQFTYNSIGKTIDMQSIVCHGSLSLLSLFFFLLSLLVNY